MRRTALAIAAFACLTVVATGCDGDDDETTPPTVPTITETVVTETETTDTETTAAQGDAAAGEQVFASAGCGGCHTLSEAGSSGTVGPKLDGASLTFDQVVTQVQNGGGAMPAFSGTLSEQQIRDVAAFVVAASAS
jgi:cytochrome c6